MRYFPNFSNVIIVQHSVIFPYNIQPIDCSHKNCLRRWIMKLRWYWETFGLLSARVITKITCLLRRRTKHQFKWWSHSTGNVTKSGLALAIFWLNSAIKLNWCQYNYLQTLMGISSLKPHTKKNLKRLWSILSNLLILRKP